MRQGKIKATILEQRVLKILYKVPCPTACPHCNTWLDTADENEWLDVARQIIEATKMNVIH